MILVEHELQFINPDAIDAVKVKDGTLIIKTRGGHTLSLQFEDDETAIDHLEKLSDSASQ